jgi:hypothetical protein
MLPRLPLLGQGTRRPGTCPRGCPARDRRCRLCVCRPNAAGAAAYAARAAYAYAAPNAAGAAAYAAREAAYAAFTNMQHGILTRDCRLIGGSYLA